MKLKNGVCNKCGSYCLESAGCSHASCGGIFVEDPLSQSQHLIAASTDEAAARLMVRNAGPDAEEWFTVRLLRQSAAFHRKIASLRERKESGQTRSDL